LAGFYGKKRLPFWFWNYKRWRHSSKPFRVRYTENFVNDKGRNKSEETKAEKVYLIIK
jgi:hypothetical protein